MGDLSTYAAKRDFSRTKEPRGGKAKATLTEAPGRFVIHKHAARRLHYDLRLEHDGVLWSWAVTKGPSLDPAEKAARRARRGPPARLWRLRGHHPAGPIWWRHRHAVGRRPLAARRRRRLWHEEGSSDVRAEGREALRRVASGADEAAPGRARRQLALDEGRRRGGADGRRYPRGAAGLGEDRSLAR